MGGSIISNNGVTRVYDFPKKMSEIDAKSLAQTILRNNKYHRSEYVYVADENLNFIAAPLDPELINFLHSTDWPQGYLNKLEKKELTKKFNHEVYGMKAD